MSVIIHIKSLIIAEMRSTDPRLRTAILNVINAIDTDLDVQGYDQDSNVDKSIVALDRTICEIGIEKEDAEVLSRPKVIKGEIPEVLRDDL